MTPYNWLLELFANIVEAAMLIVFLQKFFVSKTDKKWPYLLSVAFIFILITTLNYFHVASAINLICYIAIAVVLEIVLFSGNTFYRILMPLLMIALIMIPEILVVGIFGFVFPSMSDQDFLNENLPYRMIGIVITKVLLIALVYVAGRFSKKEHSDIPATYSLSLMIVPFFSIVCLLTISQYILAEKTALSPIWFVLSAIGLLGINLLIIYLFEAFMKYSRNQSRYQLMLQQAEMLSAHLKETNALQEETHRIWHDMKNHFTVIEWMVRSQSYEKLGQYMVKLSETVTSSMPRIQSGNPILDALLNPKAAEAAKYNIEFDVNAAVPAKISIDDIDLSIVFSNALDNAMDACKKLPEGEARFIHVNTYIRNDNLVLLIKNSFDGKINKSGSELKSTKSDAAQHGIGMGNIKRVVNKYEGQILAETDEKTFILSIMMYCKI